MVLAEGSTLEEACVLSVGSVLAAVEEAAVEEAPVEEGAVEDAVVNAVVEGTVVEGVVVTSVGSVTTVVNGAVVA